MPIPTSLKSIPHWVCYTLEPDKSSPKPRKVPKNPLTGTNAKPNDPTTWSTYDAAVSACSHYSYAGLGFMLTKDTHLVAIDIDHCYDPATATFNETATSILARQPTYAELSPSGDGVHLWFYGEKPGSNSKNSTSGVEMYDTLRYLTVTGNTLPDSLPEIAAAGPDTLRWIYETYISAKKPPNPSEKPNKSRKAGSGLSDEELLEKAAAGKKGADFKALWEGRWQDKYPSQSEADLALCQKLAYWTGKNPEQMDRLFRRSALMRDKWDVKHHADGATYGAETLHQAIERTRRVYNPDGDKDIFEHEGQYYCIKGDSVHPLTNFTVRPIEMIESEDETQMTADLITDQGETFRLSIMTSDFTNLQRFKALLNSRTISLSWFGTEGELELFKTFLSKLDWVRKKGVRACGIYLLDGSNVFVCSEGTVNAAGDPVTDVVQLERTQAIKTGLLQAEPLTADALKNLGQYLLNYNEPAKTVSVLGWVSGCFLKPMLKQCDIKFPHLFLIGEAGSGKSTTLERIILPIFAATRIMAATQVTPFTLMKEAASSNLIPLAMDEFKPSKIDKLKINTLYNHFRDSYDGHDGVRGRVDQSIETYKLLAPLTVAGEESADEAAIRERTVELLFSKKDLKEVDHKLAFNRIGAMKDALAALGRSLLNQALRLDIPAVRSWYGEVLPLFNQSLPSRVINNLACCYCGLKLVEMLCVSHGLTWTDVFPMPLSSCAGYLEHAAQDYLLDGSTNNKTVVEQTFEVMARMPLDPKNDFAFNDDKTVLYIRLNRVYDAYTKYRKDYAIVGEVLPFNQFKKQLMHSDCFLDSNVQRRFGEQNAKCWKLDFTTLSAQCDVSGFLIMSAKPLT